MTKLVALILLAAFITASFAKAQDLYSFSTKAEQKRFVHLTEQYRCLVCQNESLADSNAPLAKDLRSQVADLINGGATDNQITHYLVKRYGDFILLHPPVKSTTYALWMTPFVLLIGGAFVIFIFVRRRRASMVSELTSAERQALAKLLKNRD